MTDRPLKLLLGVVLLAGLALILWPVVQRTRDTLIWWGVDDA